METGILQKCLFVVIKHCHRIRKNSFDGIVDVMKTNKSRQQKAVVSKNRSFFFYTNRGSKPHLPIENLFDSCLGRCDGESQKRYTRKCPLCKLCLQDTE